MIYVFKIAFAVGAFAFLCRPGLTHVFEVLFALRILLLFAYFLSILIEMVMNG